MKIFLSQINPVVGDLQGNAEKILEISAKAFQSSADLIITPELSLWGYPPKDLLLKKNLINLQYEILDQLSIAIHEKYNNLSLTIGIAEQINDSYFPNLYNSIALIENGKWSIIARKIILPNYEVFDEKRYFRSANKVSLLSKKINEKTWKIGITICEDLWVNENIQGRGMHKKNPINHLEDKNIDLIINFSASPYTLNKMSQRNKISEFATNHLKKPLIYLNQVGANDNLIFDGNSFILNKNGVKICQLRNCAEDSLCWKFSNKKEPIKQNIKSEIASVFDSLVLGVKDYAKKCGFNTALIGLSGGIDSALVATIATAALGKENIFCISMPSPWSSEHSKSDAKEFANKLEISLKTLPINDLMNSFDNTFKKNINFNPKGTTSENIQSRIRGTLLMALANQEKHLLLSTGNKSELAVGYCTLYGDMNGGLSVIGDLYKTNVFSLCQWLDSEESLNERRAYDLPINNKIIGDNIYLKPPSAELGPNQLDTDSLPPYSVLDKILASIIEKKKDIKELQDDGYEKDLIIKIMNLIKRSEFKRKQAPPILRLSNQSLGSDWRIPIAIF